MAPHVNPPAPPLNVDSSLPDAAALNESWNAVKPEAQATARPLSAVIVGVFDDVDGHLQPMEDSRPEPTGREARTISSTHLGQLQPGLPASRLAEDQRRMQTASVSPLSQQSAASRAGSQLFANDENRDTEEWDFDDFEAELVDDVDVQQVIEDEVAERVHTGGKPRKQLIAIKPLHMAC